MIKTAAEQGTPTGSTLPSATPGTPPPAVVADRYQIERELGQGGMGRVYVALDRKLGRRVALKMLSGAHTPEALQRFELEARAAGSLNHPNVLAVYDIGASEQGPYIVSELLGGQTLRARLAGRPLPLRKALELSVQLAQGLAAAHDKGVIHRDLKPENLFVTEEGRLKVLDFGIAKLAGEKIAQTGQGPITQTGTIMGTVGYMSPEQVRGDQTDHRTDLFSFGAILHETLTGKMAFERPTPVETGSAILNDEPRALPESVPEELQKIVERCLEKDARDRFQSARDLAFQLASIHVTGTGKRAPLKSTARLQRRLAFAFVGTLGLIGAFALGRRYGRAPAPVPLYTRLNSLDDWPFLGRFAPDGISVYYNALRPRRGTLSLTRVDRPHSTQVGVVGAHVIAISRAGELLLLQSAFFDDQLGVAQGTLARMSVNGGAPRPFLEDVSTADYLPDGSLALVRHKVGDPHWIIELPAGHPVYDSGTYIGTIRASPDGQRLAFADQPIAPDDRGYVAVVDRTGHVQRLSGEWNTVQGVGWSPSGDEIWFGAGLSWNAELHAVTLEGRERLLARIPAQLRLLDVDPQGRALVRATLTDFGAHCLPPGSKVEVDCSVGEMTLPEDLTPDGKQIVAHDEGPAEGRFYGAYLGKSDGSPAVRLGEGHGRELSADGKWVLATIEGDGRTRVVLYPTGPGEPYSLPLDPDFNVRNVALMPDAKWVAVAGVRAAAQEKIWLYEIGGKGVRALPFELKAGMLEGVSLDGRELLVHEEHKLRLLPVSGGPERSIEASTADDWAIAGRASAREIYVVEYPPRPREGFPLYRLPLDGSPRKLVRLFTSQSEAGMSRLRVSADASAYMYAASHPSFRLYLVEGLR